MRIESLELVGYDRFKLNHIERFVLKPTARFQLILGTNGSGKSSLMQELSPLPGNKDDFLKEGSKTIQIRHQGNLYRLRTSFQGALKHSFEKNDEELNPGGTMTVQKELIKQEFKYDSDVHEVVTGQLLFTDMGPQERRVWFTRLSDVNYDYAISIYMRFLSRLRDTTGAMRREKERLVKETAKIISVEEEMQLRASAQEIERELAVLQAERQPIEHSSQSLKDSMVERVVSMQQCSVSLIKMRKVIEETRTYASIEAVNNSIDLIRHAITEKETRLKVAVGEHEKLDKTFQILSKTNGEGVESLHAKQVPLRAEEEQHIKACFFGKFSLHEAEGALLAVKEPLIEIALTIAPNPAEDGIRYYSQANQAKINDRLDEARQKVIHQQSKVAEGQHHVNLMKAHKNNGSISCPKCKYTWVEGYSDEKLASYEVELEKRTHELVKLQAEVKHCEDEYQDFSNYRNQWAEFHRMKSSWPALQPLWNYMNENDIMYTQGTRVPVLLEFVQEDLLHERAAKQCRDQLAELDALIVKAVEVGDANLQGVTKQLNEVDDLITTISIELRQLQQDLANEQRRKQQFEEVTRLGNELEQLMSSIHQLTADVVEAKRRELILNAISTLQRQLAVKSEALSEINVQKGIVQDIARNIETLKLEESALQAIVKELSPTEGLIAEGLLGFIRRFTAQMNIVIKKVWTYPLRVMDCGVNTDSGAELDYRFPLVVDDSTPKKDVAQGSSAMLEIINLAFRVTAMRYLGLQEAPLFLDEFGKTMDESHRSAVNMAVKSIMDHQQFSQLFMVNHYESIYGSLTEAEICVLDARNITVPTHSKYNQHVVIQ